VSVLSRSLDFDSNVTSEVLFLKFFPGISVELYSAESKELFIVGEFTVLTKSVKAEDILDLLFFIG
jgi:hypothetical protein